MKKSRILEAILRQDFRYFIEKVFNELNPGIKYEHNWHIDLFSDYLMDTKEGKRIIINIPPRSLKSIIFSVAYPAYLLGKNPTKRIITASFARNLAIKHSLDTRFIMESNWYKRLFPATILSPKQNQKSKFLTTKGGFRMAASVGSMITGEGADILIIDDPHNPSHINSSIRRQQVVNWYEQTFSTRLNNKEQGSIFLIMQRLHKADLTGYIENAGGFKSIKIPAIAGEDLEWHINDKQYFFKKGEIFHSKRFAARTLKNIEQEMGLRNYAAQYMQNPLEENIGIINKSQLHFYDKLPKDFDYYVLSIDSAIKTHENSDYSVCSIWGIKEKICYLAFLYRAKPPYPELKRRIIYYIKRYRPKFTLIEDYASGSSLSQDLKYEAFDGIISIRPKLDKITRFASVANLVESGRILFPENDILIREITSFPHSKNDDIVDSISQFLKFMKDKENREPKVRNL